MLLASLIRNQGKLSRQVCESKRIHDSTFVLKRADVVHTFHWYYIHLLICLTPNKYSHLQHFWRSDIESLLHFTCVLFLWDPWILIALKTLGWESSSSFITVICCVFQPANACLRMRSHGRKQWKTLENYQKSTFFIVRTRDSLKAHVRTWRKMKFFFN